MRNVILYPAVPRVRRLFVGVKRCTLPNQCMSLAEMLRRYVRREPLPAAKDGVYVETDYDLEKLTKMDRVEQEEVLTEMKQTVARKRKVVEDEDKKVSEAKAAKKKAEEGAMFDQLSKLSQKDPVDPSPKQP